MRSPKASASMPMAGGPARLAKYPMEATTLTRAAGSAALCGRGHTQREPHRHPDGPQKGTYEHNPNVDGEDEKHQANHAQRGGVTDDADAAEPVYHRASE